MAFKFPEFLPGEDQTLLQSKWARMVKRFIEAFNSPKVVRGTKDELKISDTNVVLTLTTNHELHYDDGERQINIDGDGFEYVEIGSVTVKINTSDGVKLTNGTSIGRIDNGGGFSSTNGTYTCGMSAGEITVVNGSFSLTIDPSLVTRNLTLREIDVCDAGVAKKMLVIASAPYV